MKIGVFKNIGKAYFKTGMRYEVAEMSPDKRMEDLLKKLDDSFTVEDLHPAYGYGKSRCRSCNVSAYPFDKRETPDERTILSSNRRVIEVEGKKMAVYDPIYPKCGKTLPAALLGGRK